MRFELEQGTGECRVGADGLYWVIDAVCARSGPDAPRLYCDGRSLGPFCPENGKWRLQTRVSNRALPITPQSVFFGQRLADQTGDKKNARANGTDEKYDGKHNADIESCLLWMILIYFVHGNSSFVFCFVC